MQQRKLGETGLSVSTLCLGTMTFGEADERSFMHGVGCDERTSHAIMSRALDAGCNFFDTADIYGQDGLSERIIGGWFKETGRRDEVVLATKFRFTMPYGKGGSRRHILRACEESLRRLRTDHVDLYQIHMQDLDTPEEETLRALDDLVRQGKVLYTGASNYTAWRLMDSAWTSRTEGLARYCALQMQYSLLERNIEWELVPACRRMGVGIIAWSPLASGFLSGKYRRDAPPPEDSRLARWRSHLAKAETERGWAVIDALHAIAAELHSTPARVALAWLLRKDCVTSVIFGARTLGQLEDNLAAAALVLDTDQLRRLDEASALPLIYPYEFNQRISGRW